MEQPSILFFKLWRGTNRTEIKFSPIVIDVVVVNKCAVDKVVCAFCQIAEFRVVDNSSFPHAAEYVGCVVLWCQVEVVGDNEFNTAITILANAEHEEAGLSLVAYRKAKIRKVGDRRIFDF